MPAGLDELLPQPERPPQVPAQARWFFDSEEWLLCERDAAGELHGALRTYRTDGTPWTEYEYRHGKRHGPFRRFYASGAPEREGRYFDDLLDGLLIVHSEGDNVYSIRECCVPLPARQMKQEHRRGQLLAESFYDATGTQVFEPHLAPAADAVTWPEPLREREHDVLLGEFEFWPTSEPLVDDAQGSVVVEQSADSLAGAIQRAAARVSIARDELVVRGLTPIPPDVSAFLRFKAPELRSFSFETAEEPPTLVRVDETLAVSPLNDAALRAQARIEWTALCWLCWAAGLDRVALPHRLEPREDLYAALLTTSARQAELSGHDLKPAAEPQFHGLLETQLPASALAHLADVYREARAVLLFATDPECRSPWQDDLGRDEGSASGERDEPPAA